MPTKEKRAWENLKASGLCVNCQNPDKPRVEASYYCARCNETTLAAKRRYREVHRATINAEVRRKRASLRDVIRDHYGNKCACCGETRPWCLQIDHINNDGYIHRKQVGSGAGDMYRWIIANDFPSTFQLLCANCNFGKLTSLNGRCPHEIERYLEERKKE